ncbi:MAG: ABC transporter ATP-binding protein [Clostridia bacterium]|nr:ABC transporter ATP-binding protein [Clostridia bacterium]
MLEFKNVTVGYGKRPPVLQSIGFTAGAGEITVLLGQNGCGKSTLLRAAMQEIPYTGQIFSDEGSLSTMPPAQRAKCISLLPQHLPAPAVSVREAVALGLAPWVTRPGEAEWQKVDQRVAELGLSSLADRPVNTLSGGERQKVFLAMLLTQDTPILLLDEPTTYMDLSFVARFFDILKKERARGKTFLLVMHDVSDALWLADRVVVLAKGALAFCGTPHEALEQCIPEKQFGLTRYTAQRGEKTAYFFRAT